MVLASDSGGVRLGIEAPASVGIVREEVVQRIAEENIRAGATQDQRVWLEGLAAGADSSGGEEGLGSLPPLSPAATNPDPEEDG